MESGQTGAQDVAVRAALGTTVGMLTARFERLDAQQRALLGEWLLDDEGLDRDPVVLLSVLWSVLVTLLTDVSAACGYAVTNGELLAPEPRDDTAHQAVRSRLEDVLGGENADSGVHAVALAERFGVGRVVALLVDDLARLVVLTAMVTGRRVSDQLQLLGRADRV